MRTFLLWSWTLILKRLILKRILFEYWKFPKSVFEFNSRRSSVDDSAPISIYWLIYAAMSWNCPRTTESKKSENVLILLSYDIYRALLVRWRKSNMVYWGDKEQKYTVFLPAYFFVRVVGAFVNVFVRQTCLFFHAIYHFCLSSIYTFLKFFTKN